MALYKYKSFEEAEKALWCFNPDEQYYKKVAELFNLAEKLYPLNCPRGIFKFKNIQEAQKHRDKWILENAIKRNKIKDTNSTINIRNIRF
jgi:hypothetical protein